MGRSLLLGLAGLLAGAVCISVVAVTGLMPVQPAVVSSASHAKAVGRDVQGLAFAPGATAPDFALPDVAGDTIELAMTRGQRVALLFISPTCPYCTRMAEQLALAQVTAGSEMLVICTGSTAQAVQIAKVLGDRIAVLADTLGAVSGMYGVSGVPAAYLLDTSGKVAATAVGMDRTAVLLENVATFGGDRGP